ncbi:hypothetical protein EG329_010529 [Mollisiaceae sp. DMI_Dod_QoI]|nr:hypothetical protein EG329_010529 [Helotiales sp. DMI_Dod_QoI]
MDFVYKFRDSVVEYLSPSAKRRRTIGPTTTPSKQDEKPMFDAPTSEPQGSKAQAVMIARVSRKYVRNPRKRTYEEDELETVVTVKPEDSVSQVGPVVESKEEEEDDEDVSIADEENGDGDGGSDTEGNKDSHDEEQESDDAMEVDTESEDEIKVGSEDELDVREINSDAEVEADDEISDATSITDGKIETGELEEEADIEEEMVDTEAKETAAADAKVKEYLARQAELALRREDVEKVKAAGDWHPDAIFLFERLSFRSFEEVLPDVYKIDFSTLPEDIFAPSSQDTFVNYNCRSYANGARALQALLRLGVRAREKLEAVGSAEQLIAKGIQDYIKWSERDGGYDKMRFLPVLVVVAARPRESTTTISTAIEDQLKFLAERHREHLALPKEHINELGEIEKYSRRPPLLYGMIVARTMVIFVTMDSADASGKIKHLNHFDFKDKPMDVWNGFAIAYMVIMARNYIMSIKDELEEETEESSDPDL